MGLDMMLYSTEQGGTERIERVYWRKCNQIHNWFVQNVQNGEDDCGYYEVTPEQLQQLSDLCSKVLENPESAPELLPRKAGFFFGSHDYDGWYLGDLHRTIKYIKDFLENHNQGDVIEYHSSW